MSDSSMITPSYLAKICKVMKTHGVRRVTMAGLQVVMSEPGRQEILDGITETESREPNLLRNEPITAPASVDELDELINLSKFEVFDNE